MPRIQLRDLPVDETLDASALQRVRGGIIAVLIGRQQLPGCDPPPLFTRKDQLVWYSGNEPGTLKETVG